MTTEQKQLVFTKKWAGSKGKTDKIFYKKNQLKHIRIRLNVESLKRVQNIFNTMINYCSFIKEDIHPKVHVEIVVSKYWRDPPFVLIYKFNPFKLNLNFFDLELAYDSRTKTKRV